MEKRPPGLAEKFLLFFLKEELVEEVLGDLNEKFYLHQSRYSLKRARLNYWFQVFNYLRPFAFKNHTINFMLGPLLKHNFLISFRVLRKNKGFSIINIGGLALGMTVAMLIGLWVYDEFSFNRNHDHYDSIVQVLRKDYGSEETYVNSSLAGMVGVFMEENYSNYFEYVAMTFFRTNELLLTIENESFDVMGYFFQPRVGELLSLNMLAGTRNGLDNVSGILISESLANKFFKGEDPLGKTIDLNLSVSLTVTGIYEDLPKNSTFSDAQFFASQYLIYNKENPYSWDNYNMRVYAQLKDNVSLESASAAVKDILTPHRRPGDSPIELLLLPMKDWHLNAYFENGIQVRSKRMGFIQLYTIIGLFVLLIACINFMNLNTARYQIRAKEIGVRKTIGSFRSALIMQFLTEPILYALAALGISIFAVFIVMPWFNEISDKDINVPWLNLWFWLSCLGFTFITAFVAGSYPALLLSSFNPVKAIKGNIRQGKGSVQFRQALVIFQFTISIILIIGTITVYQQIQYAKDRPVGYNQDRLITLTGRSEAYYEKYDLLRNELKNTGVVVEMAEANYPLMTTLGNNNGFSLPESDHAFETTFNTIFVTPEYGKTTEWELVQGRDFTRDLTSEVASIIVSESAVEKMGLQDPIGQEILSRSEYKGRKRFTIIGVVKDMIKGSPFSEVRPLMVFPSNRSLEYLFIRIAPNVDYATSLNKIEQAFLKVLPGNPFNFQFVDEQYLTKFRSEEQIGSLATLFSVLAILISCLGLFGLSAFMATQRIKEIGIRKVMGASVASLWSLLSRDFGVLVIIASILSIPIASYFINNWLDGYDYQVELHWWVYLMGSLLCVLVTLLTVSYHSLKVSYENPINALRSE